MKAIFAAFALMIVATSTQASDIKIYDKSKQEIKMASGHKTGSSTDRTHGRAGSGSKAKGAVSQSKGGLNRVQESAIKGDKHKKKASKSSKTKF